MSMQEMGVKSKGFKIGASVGGVLAAGGLGVMIWRLLASAPAAWSAYLLGEYAGKDVNYSYPCTDSVCQYQFDPNTDVGIHFSGADNLTDSAGQALTGLQWHWQDSHDATLTLPDSAYNETFLVGNDASKALTITAAAPIVHAAFTVSQNGVLLCEQSEGAGKSCPASESVAADSKIAIVGQYGGTVSVNGGAQAATANFDSGSNVSTNVNFYDYDGSSYGHMILLSAVKELCTVNGMDANNKPIATVIDEGVSYQFKNMRLYSDATIDCTTSNKTIDCTSSSAGSTADKAILSFSSLGQVVSCTVESNVIDFTVPTTQPTVSTFTITENGASLCTESIDAKTTCPSGVSVAAHAEIVIASTNEGAVSINGSTKAAGGNFSSGSLATTQVQLFDSSGMQLREVAITAAGAQLCAVSGTDNTGTAVSTNVIDGQSYTFDSMRLFSTATVDCTGSQAGVVCSGADPSSTADKAILAFTSLGQESKCTVGASSVSFAVPSSQPALSTFTITQNGNPLCTENIAGGVTCPATIQVAADATIAVTGANSGLISVNDSTKAAAANFSSGSLSTTQVGLFDSGGMQEINIAMTAEARQLCVAGYFVKGDLVNVKNIMDGGTYSIEVGGDIEFAGVECIISKITPDCTNPIIPPVDYLATMCFDLAQSLCAATHTCQTGSATITFTGSKQNLNSSSLSTSGLSIFATNETSRSVENRSSVFRR